VTSTVVVPSSVLFPPSSAPLENNISSVEANIAASFASPNAEAGGFATYLAAGVVAMQVIKELF